MKRFGLVLAVVAAAGVSAQALELDAIYGSHMVLQQGREVPISGTMDSSSPVIVEYGNQKVRAKQKGKKWQAVLDPMPANATGASLIVRQGQKTIELENVVVGEVWIASGQSNMLWRLNQTPQSAKTISEANHPNFRFFHSEPQVHTNHAVYNEALSKRLEEGKMYEGKWSECSPKTVARMSAVGYYFGTHLQKQLPDVPVGVIHCSLGGSEMLAWMPERMLKRKYKSCLGSGWLDSKYISAWVRGRARHNIGGKLTAPHPYKPGYLYETGIEPWQRFPVAGVIWYQGESDAELQDIEQNKQLLTDLIGSWRAAFRNKKLPFVMVQLPRINDSAPLRRYWPEFRLVQALAAEELPAVYSVTTMDLGSMNSDVHPPRKVEVGERLANTAAAKVYGKDCAYTGPVATRVQREAGALRVSYQHAKGLKTTNGEAPVGFEVAGADKKYHPAQAVIDGEIVVLKSEAAKNPQYARYAWATFMKPNLVNADGLPAVPFSPELYQQSEKR